MKNLFIAILVAWLSQACQSTYNQDDPNRLTVVSTTGMLHDAVINIAGDKVNALPLMGPGVDPHLYKATQGDLSRLNNADLIIYNGLYLEGKMGEVLDKLGRRKHVLAAGESVPVELRRASEQYEDAYDPHIWFDVQRWTYAVRAISSKLIELDTTNRSWYLANTERYLSSLDSLDNYARNQIAQIPRQRRILITAHDAFGYFGEAYNIQVEGIQGLSTVTDFGLRDISDISELIISRQVSSIFVETSVSEKAITAVIEGCKEQGHNVKIGGSLFSDAMGEFGTYEGTYIGMVKRNVDTIVRELK